MTEMHERLWHEWYDLWHETDASASKPSYEDWLEARIEALERVRRAAEVINIATHEANKGAYLGKTCPHGNLPLYPTHGRWCDECWQELEDALAALAAEDKKP